MLARSQIRRAALGVAVVLGLVLGPARAARAEDPTGKRLVLVGELGVGSAVFDKDPGRRTYALGLDGSWRLTRAVFGLALERTSQWGGTARELSLTQVLGHLGYQLVQAAAWTFTARVMAGGSGTTLGAQGLNLSQHHTGLSGGPSVVLDWRALPWLVLGLEGRATFQLYSAENPFTSSSLLLLLRAGVTF